MKGGFLGIDSGPLADALAIRGTFTLMRDYGTWGLRQAVLVVRDTDVVDAGTLADARMQVTGQRGLRYLSHVEFDPPLAIRDLRQGIAARFRSAFDRAIASEGNLASGTWDEVKRVLLELASSDADALRDLFEGAVPDSPPRRLLALEKDATSLAAEIFDARREDRLLLRRTSARGDSPFVTALTGGRAYEDPVVDFDARRVPGMEGIENPNGVAKFQRGNELLVVCNVNKKPLEATLGADLIYYNEPLESFVLVQYKMLQESGSGEPMYRPDAQLRDEIDRMLKVPIGAFNGDPLSWRLHPSACFLKLCDPPKQNTSPEQLLRGMYLPLAYLDVIEKSKHQGKGPRKGTVLGTDTVTRFLTNGLFVKLVRGGWIGSYAATSADLRNIVHAQYDADHSVTVAAQRTISAWGLPELRARPSKRV
ncbi:hypothetical protein [Candidatus Solirubrobacter pratensis]|uniref:hypothetical protein n=1 Tax=Candidatus Solirubrobacter pratensis TaxID=1298857 RepID=UPI0004293FF0|nr:hypothetical protein [Candidatus Solirubrobacter pratensis]